MKTGQKLKINTIYYEYIYDFMFVHYQVGKIEMISVGPYKNRFDKIKDGNYIMIASF